MAAMQGEGRLKEVPGAEMLKRAKQVFKLFNNGGSACSSFYEIKGKYVIVGYYDSNTY